MDMSFSSRNKGNSLLFSEIRTPEEMLVFLKDDQRLKHNDMLYHYCGLEKLERILKNKQWYFSSPKGMNDHYEYEKFHHWSGKYFLCFMKTTKEEISMWSMYGQPWTQGVRIGMPVKTFKNWIQKTKYVTRTEKYGGSIINNVRCYFGDVLYADDDPNADLITGNNTKNIYFKPYKHEEMAGYVKDVAWGYEKECRFHIDIPYCEDDGVLVDMPDEVIQDMTIMTGPRFRAFDDLKAHLLNGIKTDSSKFTDKLSWVYCDNCPYKKKRVEKALTSDN